LNLPINLVALGRENSMFNPFKKKEAEVSEKVKARKDKQEERRQKAQARGHKPIK
jgi:hypothetical protein